RKGLQLPPDRSTAIVLGGGGVLGAVQIGMLRALAEAGVRPDLVVGTSIGALNEAVLAALPRAKPRLLAHEVAPPLRFVAPPSSSRSSATSTLVMTTVVLIAPQNVNQTRPSRPRPCRRVTITVVRSPSGVRPARAPRRSRQACCRCGAHR
ncbi:MAG: patatin-like phospholipase family protein, partial [Pseudonocardiaceae bacterium]